MKYQPMPNNMKNSKNMSRYCYITVVSIYTKEDDYENNITRNISITTKNILTSDEVAQHAANLIYDIVDNQEDFHDCDLVQITGIMITDAYDMEL